LPNHAHFCGFMGFWYSHRNPEKAHAWVKPRHLRYRPWKFVHPFLLYATTRKKRREGKERKGKVSHKVTKGLYLRYMGRRPPTTDCYENWQGWRAHDVIIVSNFGFNSFRGFRFTGGRNLHCPIDFASLLVIVTTVLPLPRSLWYYNTVVYILICRRFICTLRAKLHYKSTRTPAPNTGYEHHQRTSSQQFDTINGQKFATFQHLDMSICWALALRCGKFVVELLWARPLVVSVGGVVQHVRSRWPCSGVWPYRINATPASD